MDLHSKDFSFVSEKPVSQFYMMLAELKLKPNLMQTGAVTIHLCIDDNADKLEKLALTAGELFDVHITKGLSLLTIRHYNSETIDQLSTGHTVLLRQQTTETLQLLLKK